MSEQAELAFFRSFVNNLASQPVVYPDDFQQPPEGTLRKVPVLPVPLPPAPERKSDEVSQAATISVTFKSTKPPQSYTLSIQPTDAISDIKAQLATVPGAPPADAQRLLLKGKALADGKLLKEYSVKDGDVINLMVKPGFEWDPSKVAPAPVATPRVEESPSITLLPEQPKTRSGHGRIPSVVLSPSPSLKPSTDEKLIDIPLVLDNIPTSAGGPHNTSYHETLSQPAFWEHLHTFLSGEFPNKSDAAMAWEDFFCASKGTLSVNDIAKIRDSVGVVGMAGT